MNDKDYSLFLDDCREPPKDGKNWTVCRSYNEFVQTVELRGLPEFVTFDHDLADEHYGGDFSKEKTGLDAARWLMEYCTQQNKTFPNWGVHSMNPVGRKNIIDEIVRFIKDTTKPTTKE